MIVGTHIGVVVITRFRPNCNPNAEAFNFDFNRVEPFGKNVGVVKVAVGALCDSSFVTLIFFAPLFDDLL